ncbi:NAC domain-containing protein [Canna indica]|uniref:NAC domain-containing protein n=1 Tax=Canna indica TaxID=4628 RepID=A0AAQ3KF23_9LILI|nr:NAC domain-containing protein [Canna indica]
MAIAAPMSGSGDVVDAGGRVDVDGHEHDLVMPGFRFHPTEEELIEFYLRRKVEGKRFNVELITFLDLYRYDPWELPALAAIGEKEWFFYVPRDRKYRNGDRPNRVTTSGYWKATGADRMIRSEGNRSIGLKKTLVFYSGKAPKGIRTSWIMNEYRLPQSETAQQPKVEISICRVYKRAGVDDRHHRLPGTLPSKSSSSLSRGNGMDKKHNYSHHPRPGSHLGEDSLSAAMADAQNNLFMASSPAISKHTAAYYSSTPPSVANSLSCSTTSTEEDGGPSFRPILGSTSSSMAMDELNKMVYLNNLNQFLHLPSSQTQLLPYNYALPISLPTTVSDKLWDWNSLQGIGREYNTDSK